MKKIIRLLIFLMIMVLASCGDEEPTTNGPTACFTTPSVITAGIAADFSSSCSENADSYAWDFGDGTAEHPLRPILPIPILQEVTIL